MDLSLDFNLGGATDNIFEDWCAAAWVEQPDTPCSRSSPDTSPGHLHGMSEIHSLCYENEFNWASIISDTS